MPVAQAEKEVAVERNHIYVIPPNTTLTVRDQPLHLAIRPSAPARHMPVDALLKSLAADWGDASIGVILSGGDSDGALGIEAIKHEDGITFAQEPACRIAHIREHLSVIDLVTDPANGARRVVLGQTSAASLAASADRAQVRQ